MFGIIFQLMNNFGAEIKLRTAGVMSKFVGVAL